LFFRLLVHVTERNADMLKPEQNQPTRRKLPVYGFIPKRLKVADKPEYSHFPFNVLFVSYRNQDGRLQAGSALYEPDFQTYRKEGHLSSMRYDNTYGAECHLVIDYDEKTSRYRGEKFVNRKAVGSAYGGDNWQLFFTHFTMLGLADGEKCKFEFVKDVLASTSAEGTPQ
jgi:hypothetical protein